MSKQVQAYIREINEISPELSKTIAQIPKTSGGNLTAKQFFQKLWEF